MIDVPAAIRKARCRNSAGIDLAGPRLRLHIDRHTGYSSAIRDPVPDTHVRTNRQAVLKYKKSKCRTIECPHAIARAGNRAARRNRGVSTCHVDTASGARWLGERRHYLQDGV